MAEAVVDEDEAVVQVLEIMADFAEWLEDGAGDPDGKYERVFDPDFMIKDERSWDDLSREFLKVYAQRQARIARLKAGG